MPNPEIQQKCRRLFYVLATGQVMGLASAGGAMESLTGDDLIRATFSLKDDSDPTLSIGVIEEYYSPLHGRKPVSLDLTKVPACQDAVAAHRAADQEKADFILECSIECGAECTRETDLRHVLKVAEIRTRSDSARHDDILAKQGQLDACCAKCDTCCDTLLTTRDAAVTYAAAVVE